MVCHVVCYGLPCGLICALALSFLAQRPKKRRKRNAQKTRRHVAPRCNRPAGMHPQGVLQRLRERGATGATHPCAPHGAMRFGPPSLRCSNKTPLSSHICVSIPCAARARNRFRAALRRSGARYLRVSSDIFGTATPRSICAAHCPGSRGSRTARAPCPQTRWRFRPRSRCA